jgi:hypothetical protein
MSLKRPFASSIYSTDYLAAALLQVRSRFCIARHDLKSFVLPLDKIGRTARALAIAPSLAADSSAANIVRTCSSPSR